MIYIGDYQNCSSSNKFVSILGDCQKSDNYNSNSYPALAPKVETWKEWQNNIDKKKEEENMRFYIERYYEEVLLNLDISSLFVNLGQNFILGCSDMKKYFHPYIVSAYLELVLGIEVPEVKVENGKIKKLAKSRIAQKVNKILCETIINDLDKTQYAKTKTMKLL